MQNINEKKTEVVLLISDKLDIKAQTITGDKQDKHFIMLMGQFFNRT